jgi:hypothetical protein
MRSSRFLTLILSFLVFTSPVRGQSVIFDQNFEDANLDSREWEIVSNDESSVESQRGMLRVKSSVSIQAGVITRIDSYPLFERPGDDSEYNAYFLGVRLADRRQSAALGLFSMEGSDKAIRLPRDFQDHERMSYAFVVTPSKETSGEHWVSTMLAGDLGAAADSTGADGFHTWEYGKVYDFRIQVTRHDTTWWGRVHPSKDWIPLQDPALDIGYNGTEKGGCRAFGLFVSAIDANLKIDRIYVTHFQPTIVDTILEQRFSVDKLDKTIWSVVGPEATTNSVAHTEKDLLRIVNRSHGSRWQDGTGIWTKPEKFPLFQRPKEASQRVYVDFLGVELPSNALRCALGLYSCNRNGREEPGFPSAMGPDGGLAYYFWVLPDNDRLIQNSNQLRAGVINDKYAATDNYHHAWIWPYTEKRDLRLEITSEDVRWYLRKHVDSAWRVLRDDDEFFYRRPAIPEDRSVGYWRPLYDPGVPTQTTFDGRELHGRNRFGIFVHCSSAGSDGPVDWEAAELTIRGIRVTTVTHDSRTKQ